MRATSRLRRRRAFLLFVSALSAFRWLTSKLNAEFAEGRRVFVQPVSLILSSPTRRKSAGKTRPYGKRRHHLVAAKSRAKNLTVSSPE